MGAIPSRLNNKNQISQHDSVNNKTYIQGDHETHVSDGTECDLHTCNVACKKNPGHTKFIPVDTFTLEHLPEGQRDNVLYEYIRATADLTVKVQVKMTSPHRPAFWPKTNKPYPFYKREAEVLRTGSGMIHRMYKYTDGVRQKRDKHKKNFTKCWCRKCQHSDTSRNVWWEFYVHSAAHVVFDDIEATHTTLRLFYDSKDSPVVIVDKVSIGYVNIEHDWCWIHCVTCDEILGNKLEKMWKHYLNIRRKVRDKYTNYKSVDKLTFIVSHPHGCTKQVSVGRWVKKYKVDEYKVKFTYTTCTCPGSSGAHVQCVGYREKKWWSYNLFVHSGTDSEDNYNYSGVY